MLTKIWERYIFKDLLRCFFFFLFAFFLLYSLLDFSANASTLIKNNQMQIERILIHYMHQFFKRLPMLMPLALLISTMKVLFSLNIHKELVALQTSGVSIKRILYPFWILATFCCITGLINEEFLTPKSMKYLDQMKLAQTKASEEKNKKPFTILHLKDSSRLVYQNFDPEKKVFFDVYWIRSFQDIWRIKYLSMDPQKPLGEFVDHLVRNEKGFLEKKESYDQCILPSLKWKAGEPYKKQYSPKHQKLSQLARSYLLNERESFYSDGDISTHLFYKVIMALMPFVILLGVAPYCINYSRNHPIFLLYGISLFCFVVFFTLMDALLIIGKNQTLPPYIAIGLPFVFLLGICYKKFRSIHS
jgi:lipopolysaccharide export system permease protein